MNLLFSFAIMFGFRDCFVISFLAKTIFLRHCEKCASISWQSLLENICHSEAKPKNPADIIIKFVGCEKVRSHQFYNYSFWCKHFIFCTLRTAKPIPVFFCESTCTISKTTDNRAKHRQL